MGFLTPRVLGVELTPAKTCSSELLLPPGEYKGSDSAYCQITFVLAIRSSFGKDDVRRWRYCNYSLEELALQLLQLLTTADDRGV